MMRPVKSWSLCLATITWEVWSGTQAFSEPRLCWQPRADPRLLPVSNTKPAAQITGKISAHPNPISFGQGCVLISWEINDPNGGELRVSTAAGDEKLVSRGQTGSVEIPWIEESTEYDFRIYAASKTDVPLDTVKVRRKPWGNIFRELTTEVMHGNVDLSELSQFIASVMPRCLHSAKFRQIFPFWQRHGFHVTPVHFYQPIPDTASLPETLWNRPSELAGIDMNDKF